MTEECVQESRRRLLKIIAATGGAVATSTVLPGTWLKPVVEMGVLPAHAQLSDRAVEIFNLRVECEDCAEAETVDAGASDDATWLNGWFDWQALCDLCTSESYLTVESKRCGPVMTKRKIGAGWWASKKDQKGKVFYGTAGFCASDYCSGWGFNETDTITAWVESCGDTSNIDDVTITKILNGSGS